MQAWKIGIILFGVTLVGIIAFGVTLVGIISDRGAGDRRAPSGEKGGDVGYARLEERMAMRLSGIQEFRNPGIQEYMNSGIQELRHQQNF